MIPRIWVHGWKESEQSIKKSIYHKEIPLQKFLASGALTEQQKEGVLKDQKDSAVTQAEAQLQTEAQQQGQSSTPRRNTDDMEEMFAEFTRKLSKQ